MVQIFDSWAAQLSPMDFDVFAGPYLHYIIKKAKEVRRASVFPGGYIFAFPQVVFPSYRGS